MISSMIAIFEAIKNYNPELYLSAKDNSFIDSVALLYENQKIFRSDTLYICESFSLNGISDPEIPINLLCIVNIQHKQELLKNEHFNLIVINDQVDIMQIYHEVDEYLIDCIYVIEGSLKLSNALISHKGLQSIVDIATDIIGNPVKVTDKGLKNLASTQKYIVNDPIWDDVVLKGYTDYDKVMELKVPEKLHEIYNSDKTVYLKLNPNRWMVTRIIIEGEVAGHVTALEYLRPFKKRDEEILQYLSIIISCVINNNSKIYESFIIDLLDGNLRSNKAIEERARSISYKLNKNLCVIVVRPKQTAYVHISFLHLVEILQRMIQESKVLLYKNEIVLVISSENKISLFNKDLKSLISILKENQLYGGISPIFHSFEEMQENYILSLKAIELGVRLNSDKIIYLYEDYIDYHLIDIAEAQKDSKQFCNTHLFELMKYDKIYDTKYTESLYVYLFTGNRSKSAQILKIHRNSMDYRIKKIEEILDLNLSDPNISWSLFLSLKILIYTGEARYHQQYKIEHGSAEDQ